jgi:hypothetical protein
LALTILHVAIVEECLLAQRYRRLVAPGRVPREPRRRLIGYSAAMQREPDDVKPMTSEQAATLKRLATAAYELDAYKPNVTRAEADLRIAALAAKLKLLGEPPHTL